MSQRNHGWRSFAVLATLFTVVALMLFETAQFQNKQLASTAQKSKKDAAASKAELDSLQKQIDETKVALEQARAIAAEKTTELETIKTQIAQTQKGKSRGKSKRR